MAFYGPFCPKGPTVLVGTSSVQVTTSDNSNPSSYRVRNLLTTAQYLSWAPPAPGGAPVTVAAATAPTAGSPSANTLGMAGSATEVFGNLPAQAWFIANASANFEVTPGEGL
jgi:hypothetical protein